tara:strand:+ start:341 stop:775 length:435 start_codon:yes stop_codon:yes gene_type:complete
MKKLMNVLTILIFTVSSASAETVLYCTSELATGMIYANGKWNAGDFSKSRYTVKFDDDPMTSNKSITVKIKSSYESIPTSYTCLDKKENQLVHICNAKRGKVFFYSIVKKRFTLISGAFYSYVRGDTANYYDTQSISSGTCTDF